MPFSIHGPSLVLSHEISVCLSQAQRRRNPWISSAPGCWNCISSWTKACDYSASWGIFGACSLVQNTSQFSTQVMSWPNSRQKVGQAWGFQVSYPRPLFWHLKLLTNSHVTITCSLQPAAIGAAIVPRFVDWAPVLSRYPQWFIVVHPKLHGGTQKSGFQLTSWPRLDWIRMIRLCD